MLAVPLQIPESDSAPHRPSDHRYIARVEFVKYEAKIVGEHVKVILVISHGLVGLAHASVIEGDHTIAGPRKTVDGWIPSTVRALPAVHENYGGGSRRIPVRVP